MVTVSQNKNEKILAFDTAMSACSVALYDAGKDDFISETTPMVRGQAEQLVPMIERIMERGGVAYSDIDRIVTTVGPGAFTGLRIGLSTARALGVALNIPVSGVSTLEVLAHQYFMDNEMENGRNLLVLLETKRQDFYYQIFSAAGDAIESADAAYADDICALMPEGKETVVIGDAVSRFYKCLQDGKGKVGNCDFSSSDSDKLSLVDSRAIIKLFHTGCFFQDCAPLYLREADVSRSKKKYRKMQGNN